MLAVRGPSAKFLQPRLGFFKHPFSDGVEFTNRPVVGKCPATVVKRVSILGEWLADPQLSGRPKVEKPPPDGTTALGDVMCMASLALDFLEKLPWGTGHPLATDVRPDRCC